MTANACPCNSGKDYNDCCGPILSGAKKAETAEALMRSRYTAHVEGNFDHVANTHAKEAQDSYNKSAAQAQSKNTTWVGLDILKGFQIWQKVLARDPAQASIEFV